MNDSEQVIWDIGYLCSRPWRDDIAETLVDECKGGYVPTFMHPAEVEGNQP